jgi:hypothetical protein
MDQLNLARSNLQRERREATIKRQQHLTFRQEILVLEGKKQQSEAVATIQRAERRARCFRKFHSFTKSARTAGGLAYVTKTNSDGSQTRIQQPDDMSETLSERNRQHFAQADGTPLTCPPLTQPSPSVGSHPPVGPFLLVTMLTPQKTNPLTRSCKRSNRFVQTSLTTCHFPQ